MLEKAPTDALHYATLLDISGQIARREITSVELTRQLLDRIAALNPQLNAYLLVTAEAALAAAASADAEIAAGRHRGPLHGVPIGIKDLFEVKDAPATFATTAYSVRAERDATIIHRLKTAGAVTLGHLHLHEGAFAEHHPKLGNCINPWHKDYWPGGSSSGSGSATAAGLCYASLGTDTGGSIRFPSAACGVTGLKVTWGRTSRYGVFALADSLDTIGPMARTAADCAAMLTAFAGADPNDPTCLTAPVPDYVAGLEGVRGARGFRIGVDEAYLSNNVDPETQASIAAVIETYKALGATIVPVTVPDRTDAYMAALKITDAECAQWHEKVYKEKKAEYGPALGAAIERGLTYHPLDLSRAYITQARWRGTLASFFSGIDALISPIYNRVGLTYATASQWLDDLPGLVSYTSPYNLAGVPSITFPCGIAEVGMPIGVQLIGPHLSEGALLTAAHAYQQATDWHTRRPPLN